MEHHVGIDVSLELSSLCVLDAAGKVIREAKVASEPETLVAFLRGLSVTIVRVGLEAGPLSQWLYDGLHKAGFEPVLLETRHVKAALSAMAIKTDRRDARGIAQLLRMGWYRPVHRKSVPSQEVRALLAARKQMQIKAMDLEQTLRGLLRGFGLKVGDVSRGKLAARIRELALTQHSCYQPPVCKTPASMEESSNSKAWVSWPLRLSVKRPVTGHFKYVRQLWHIHGLADKAIAGREAGQNNSAGYRARRGYSPQVAAGDTSVGSGPCD